MKKSTQRQILKSYPTAYDFHYKWQSKRYIFFIDNVEYTFKIINGNVTFLHNKPTNYQIFALMWNKQQMPVVSDNDELDDELDFKMFN